MSDERSVMVTGASGVLGTAVVASLVQRGIPVVGVGRSVVPADFPGHWHSINLLETGILGKRLADVRTIVHCATNAMGPADDLRALDNVIAAAQSSETHVLFVSIAGIEEAAPGYRYYHNKLLAEERLVASGVPFTIVRITQFHTLVNFIFGKLSLGPVFLDPHFRLQPVDPAFAADRIAIYATAQPQHRTPDIHGPEILDGELVTAWLRAFRKRPLRLPAPRLGPLKALGRILPVNGDAGGLTWREWLMTKARFQRPY